MPKLRNPKTDYLYAEIWKKALFSEVVFDFSDKPNGMFIAQLLWKDLDNFRIYVTKNLLSSFYFPLFNKIEKVELIRDKTIVILKPKTEVRFSYLKGRKLKQLFFNPVRSKNYESYT